MPWYTSKYGGRYFVEEGGDKLNVNPDRRKKKIFAKTQSERIKQAATEDRIKDKKPTLIRPKESGGVKKYFGESGRRRRKYTGETGRGISKVKANNNN